MAFQKALADLLPDKLLQNALSLADQIAAGQDSAEAVAKLQASLRLLRMLQSPSLDGAAALEHLCTLHNQIGGCRFQMLVDAQQPLMLPAETGQTFVAMASLALENAAQHAGVERVDVLVECDAGNLSLQILDQGSGFTPNEAIRMNPNGGLATLQALARTCGAEAKVLSRPGFGTKVQIKMPLPPLPSALQPPITRAAQTQTILLVDDSNIFLSGLRTLLEANKWVVAGICANHQTALEQARTLAPAVIMLNITLAGQDTFSLMRSFKAILPQVHLVVLTDDDARDKMELAMASGANAYLRRNSNVSELITALAALEETPFQISPTLAHKFAVEGVSSISDLEGFSPIQLHILDLVRQRLTNAEIALRLDMSENGVKYHIKKIRLKLAMAKKSELFSRK